MRGMNDKFDPYVREPVSGRFAEHLNSNPEGDVLAAGSRDVMSQLAARRTALRRAGYVPAAAGPADGSPRSTDHINTWWATHYNRAEQAPDGAYPQMPDDYTPNMTGGNALSEHRRTHRMLYEGAGVAVRMPSVTAVRAYSKEIGHQTFDLPVEAEYPGGTVSGYVRVTRNGVAEWSVSGLNMPEPANSYVSEAVGATLEARRPTTALRNIKDILARRRERLASAGVLLKPTDHSEWIRGAGYNTVGNQMVIQLNGRAYGYVVHRELYKEVTTSWSPGKLYNRWVKGSRRFEVEFHDKCQRFYNKDKQHRCPSKHQERGTEVSDYNKRVLTAVAGQLS